MHYLRIYSSAVLLYQSFIKKADRIKYLAYAPQCIGYVICLLSHV